MGRLLGQSSYHALSPCLTSLSSSLGGAVGRCPALSKPLFPCLRNEGSGALVHSVWLIQFLARCTSRWWLALVIVPTSHASHHGTKETFLKGLVQVMEKANSPFFPALPYKFSTRQLFYKTRKLESLWFVLLNFFSFNERSYTIKFTLLKCTVEQVYYVQWCSHHHRCNLILKLFHHPQNKPHTYGQSLPYLPSPSTWKSLIYSLSIDLRVLNIAC